MRKTTLFISAALTTFVLAILYGVVSAYQGTVKAAEAAPAVAQAAPPTATSAPVDVSALLPATNPNLTPEQAAAMAAQVMGRTDLYSVETADYNGTGAYKVTFSSGDVVFVNPQGQILSVTKLQPVASNPPTQGSHRNKNNNNLTDNPPPSGGGGGGEGGGGDDGGGDD